MNKLFSLLCVIPMFFIVLIMISGRAIMKADINEFEEYRLQKTNNYCVDAAIAELLYSDDLDMDYMDLAAIKLDPLKARDMFLTTFALNYDMQPTDYTKDMLSAQYLDLMIVAVYDGYYVFTREGVIDTANNNIKTYQALPSLKHPYVYQDSEGLYSLNLGLKRALRLNGSGVENVELPINQMQALTVINKQLNNVINSELQKSGNGALRNVYIPVEATTVGEANNNVDSISVIAFVNGVKFTTSTTLNAFSIGGSEIHTTRMVACYIRNGKKYYCYTDLVPKEIADPSRIEEWADYVVPSIDDAAELGYYCDLELMK